jgi:hypothetical protein
MAARIVSVLLSLIVLAIPAAPTLAASDAISRWAAAVGGRDKIAAIQAIYREGTIKVAGFEGTIKVWHTAKGTYRKEERIATLSTTEVFDGTRGIAQQGIEAARTMDGLDLAQTISRRFANTNAMFFAFFPERHKGSRTLDGENTIIFKPDGGIDWRVTLDPVTSLPATMIHEESGRVVTVAFVEYETVDGIVLEKELHRSNGDARFNAVIRFVKTVINPPIDSSLFVLEKS